MTTKTRESASDVGGGEVSGKTAMNTLKHIITLPVSSQAKQRHPVLSDRIDRRPTYLRGLVKQDGVAFNYAAKRCSNENMC
jgi:hypothetical protein